MSQRQIEIQINTAIGKMVEQIFTLSQQRVPVQTGRLKASGSFKLGKADFRISYTAPYARTVEFGRPAASSIGSYTSKIKNHTRTTPSGKKVRVRAHTKTYTTGKPTKFNDGTWAVINPNQAVTGRQFLTSSVKDVLSRTFARQNGLQAFIR